MIAQVSLIKYFFLEFLETLLAESRNLNAVELKDLRPAPVDDDEPGERPRPPGQKKFGWKEKWMIEASLSGSTITAGLLSGQDMLWIIECLKVNR
jgi:hypothetical protein